MAVGACALHPAKVKVKLCVGIHHFRSLAKVTNAKAIVWNMPKVSHWLRALRESEVDLHCLAFVTRYILAVCVHEYRRKHFKEVVDHALIYSNSLACVKLRSEEHTSELQSQ